MGNHMKYLLGIDGGGTGTKMTAASMDGQILDHMFSGALNRNGQSLESFQETIAQLLSDLTTHGYEPQECGGLAMGAAGISNRAAGKELKNTFVQAGFCCPVYLYGDHETALAAAFPECHGIILIAGTGAICYGRREDGTVLRVGGYGHLIDDGGSAYAIGVDILSSIVRAEDGRGEKTLLRELVFQHLNFKDIEELIGYVYHPARSKKDIAALAVLLEQALAEGDRPALEVEEKCVQNLLQLARTVIERMKEEKNLALGGSVLLKNVRIRNKLCERLLETGRNINFLKADQDASLGALRLLQREEGIL